MLGDHGQSCNWDLIPSSILPAFMLLKVLFVSALYIHKVDIAMVKCGSLMTLLSIQHHHFSTLAQSPFIVSNVLTCQCFILDCIYKFWYMCLSLFSKCSLCTFISPNQVYITQSPLGCTAQPRLKRSWSKRNLIQSPRRARTSLRRWNVRTHMHTWKQHSWAARLPSQ